MRFCIITHVVHGNDGKGYFAYSPYVREMNLWLKHIDTLSIVAPFSGEKFSAIDLHYSHHDIQFKEIQRFDITSFKNILLSFVRIPRILVTIIQAMQQADHIHLRCPGNVGLLACIVQIFFPSTPKSAKYAGNWDPQAKQPISYRLQRWILNNTFLTRNIKVLVYGAWAGSSRNILPFFTATYTDADAALARQLPTKELPVHGSPIRFVFVGTLSVGKRPLYALELFEAVQKHYPNAVLDYFGEGDMRAPLEQSIESKNLENRVTLHGNQTKEVVEQALQEAHFLILASQSEGWPKVVAEAMFWGCVPLASSVSCVAQMLGSGSRGVLLGLNLAADVAQVLTVINQPSLFEQMSVSGKIWSHQYTTDKFDEALKEILSHA